MDWQHAATLTAIALAAGFVLWRTYRAWRTTQSTGCGGSCGCAKTAPPTQTPTLIPADQLTLRLRNKP